MNFKRNLEIKMVNTSMPLRRLKGLADLKLTHLINEYHFLLLKFIFKIDKHVNY